MLKIELIYLIDKRQKKCTFALEFKKSRIKLIFILIKLIFILTK